MPHHGEGVGVAGAVHFFRILTNVEYTVGRSGFSQTIPLGTVCLVPIEVPVPLTIDMIGYEVGGAAVGNVRLGLYPRNVVGFPDLPDGGALTLETAPLAQPGAGRIHWATVPNTALLQGQYFMGIQTDDAAATFNISISFWHHNVLGLAQPARSYAQVFGPFTNPCPVTAPYSNAFHAYMRVVSVP